MYYIICCKYVFYVLCSDNSSVNASKQGFIQVAETGIESAVFTLKLKHD